jgi:hypothetical protein
MIAVHGVADGIAPDEKIALQILSRRIRYNETVSVAMRDEPPRQLIRFRPNRRARFRMLLWVAFLTMFRGVPLRGAFLWWLRVLRALFFLGQGNTPVRVFVDFTALLHFSRKLH